MIPKDPIMLLSFINLKLRDCYSSLEQLCDDLDIDQDELTEKLSTAGYQYHSGQNRFI